MRWTNNHTKVIVATINSMLLSPHISDTTHESLPISTAQMSCEKAVPHIGSWLDVADQILARCGRSEPGSMWPIGSCLDVADAT